MSTRLLGFSLLVAVVLIGGCNGVGPSTSGSGDDESSVSAPVNGYDAQPARIYVDGDSTDWTALSDAYTDEGDGGTVDIEGLKIAHTSRYFFLQIELGQAINLQEDNSLTLYLDTDNDPTTGRQNLGVGAEVSWTFGRRSGRAAGQEVGHAALGLTSLPTVRSKTFEIALDRSATPIDTSGLFPGDSLRVALSNEGDRLPDDTGGIGYVLTDADTTLNTPSIEQPSDAAMRLLSYNSVNNFDANRSAIFSADRQPHFRRIFEAVGPDVIAFQEVYAQTAAQADSIEEDLGLSDEWSWAKEGQDLVLGSRYPIVDTHAIPGYEEYESGAFLLDAKSALGTQLIVVNMHPPCCNSGPEDGEPSSNAQRQQVVDGVAAFLREVTNGTGPFGVDENTPIVVMGDMNFVGKAQQPRTLRTGDIVNTDRFGPDAAPDWDESPLLDTNPRQTGAPLHATWIDAGSSFPPGRLDYAFVTDHVLEVVHEFVLRTSMLSDSTLRAYGLRANDTKEASDHRPVVIDVSSR